jgi:hypothetical protein
MSMPTESAQGLYYFYSTSAQAVAAIVGLSAALAIFRYQNLLQHINDAAEALVRYFAEGDLFPYLPWENRGEGAQAYRRATTANGHMNVLRRYLAHGESAEIGLRAILETQLKGNAKEVGQRVGVFRTLVASFAKYDALVADARKLRRLTVLVTSIGLLLVLTGTLLILMPDNSYFWPFLISLGVYALLTVYLTLIAFHDPLKDR